MHFTFDLLKIDWTALASIVAFISLAIAMYQTRLSQKAVQQSNAQVGIALQQAKEDRHAAIQPDLVLENGSSGTLGEDYWEKTYAVRNMGLGPARNVAITVEQEHGGQVFPFPSIRVGSRQDRNVTAGRPAEQSLVLRWENLYGREYIRRYKVIDKAGMVLTISDETALPIPDAPPLNRKSDI